jgi:hypothetical protein
MTVDFRKDKQPSAEDTQGSVTQAVRRGVAPRLAQQVRFGVDNLIGRAPLGIGAPTRGARKLMAARGRCTGSSNTVLWVW